MRMRVTAILRESLPRIMSAASRVFHTAVFGAEAEFLAAVQVLRIRLDSLAMNVAREIGDERSYDIPAQSLNDALAELHRLEAEPRRLGPHTIKLAELLSPAANSPRASAVVRAAVSVPSQTPGPLDSLPQRPAGPGVSQENC